MLKKINVIGCLLFMMSKVFSQSADTLRISEHLHQITGTEFPRNVDHISTLDSVATYINNVFTTYADTVYYQEFAAKKGGEKLFKNVISVFGSENEKTIVIGAHYDVCGAQKGADDNASGVVGLLELARLLKDEKLNYRVEMVAYTLEEPPFFRSEFMGSSVHAQSLIDNKVSVYGMVCLEMIGYFKDNKGSQDYPIGMLSLIYGKKGNYITLVNKLKKGKFSRKFNSVFKKNKEIRTRKFTGPVRLAGIDFSDHLNYWRRGFSAVMITDQS